MAELISRSPRSPRQSPAQTGTDTHFSESSALPSRSFLAISKMNLEAPDEARRAQAKQRPAKSAAASDVERSGVLRLHPGERSGVLIRFPSPIYARLPPATDCRPPQLGVLA